MTGFDERLLVLLFALILDRFMGDPAWLWQRVKHPVVLFGGLISYLDKRLNRNGVGYRYCSGVLAIALLVFLVVACAVVLSAALAALSYAGLVIEAILVSVFLAQKSLSEHVRAVYDALEHQSIRAARLRVSAIVGRDTSQLDANGVAKAAIESLAENSSDGVIAPVFWFIIGGLPLLLAYKLINTADSMIGHQNARYHAFGFGAAKLDDMVNYIPARVSVIIILGAAWLSMGYKSAKAGLVCVLQDGGKHRSPNAGWPECAYAGALNICLSGPRVYGAKLHQEPYQNRRGNKAGKGDIKRSLALYHLSLNMLVCAILVLYMFL